MIKKAPLAAALLLAGAAASLAVAQDSAAPQAQVQPPDRTEPLPPELEGVGIDEKLGDKLPLDLTFTDYRGKDVKLQSFFDGTHPVILTLNYYKCPMLCGLQLNALVDALEEMQWTVGEQFQVVTVSFDPLETYHLAALKRQGYLEKYGRPASAGGWHFMTGSKKNIDALLDATGVHVKYNEATGQWMHAASLLIVTPDGVISRYLRNIAYQPQTLKLSLLEASQGKIGTTVDQLLLYCHYYNGEGYSLAIMNIVRVFGVLLVIVVGTPLLVVWRREARRGRAQRPNT